MSKMDPAITADTSAAHLAGATGCKTCVLHGRSADRRWHHGERSQQGGAIRLFRKVLPVDDRSELLDSLAVSIRALPDEAAVQVVQ